MRAPSPIPAVLCFACALVSGVAAGEIVSVGAAEISRLGIVVSRPMPVERIELASVPAEVRIPPARQAAVSAPVAGLVSRLFVAAGEPISQGQAIAELASPEYMRIQREFLDGLANDELAASQLERDESLLAEGIIATRRLQESIATARAARLARDQARQQLAIAGLDTAAVERLIASRELAPALILRAPFDGFVVEQQATVGDALDAFEPVIRVADLSELWIEARVPQELAGRIETGMRLAAQTPRERIEATVTTIGRTVDPATQTVLVRGIVAGARTLNAGQFLTVTIASEGSRAAFAVPAAAVTHVGDGARVFLRSAEGFRMTPVDVLSENGELAYVRGAIDASAEIAVDGVSALKALLAVEPGDE